MVQSTYQYEDANIQGFANKMRNTHVAFCIDAKSLKHALV